MEKEELPQAFDQVPYSLFFKVWYHLQRELRPEDREKSFTKVGRGIGKEFNPDGIETAEEFAEALREFLVNDWGLTQNAQVEILYDGPYVSEIEVHLQDCRMCAANNYFKLADGGEPTCMFPPVIMGTLSQIRKKFGFKNIRFDAVEKPGPVGECIMTFGVR